jgi:integrase
MASVQLRGGTYRVIFRFHGKQHFVMIGKVTPEEAEAKAAQVNYLLMRIKQGLLELPPGVEIAEFVLHDGKPPAAAIPVAASRKVLTLATLRDRFLATRATGREKSTLYTAGIHFNHLVDTLGERFPLPGLGQADLQRHVERRARLGISPVTIKKELSTLRTAWQWAVDCGLLSGNYPNRGLVYPKDDESPPYQTRGEIERQVAAGGLKPAEIDELWDALYLRPHEIAELLEHVRTHARHEWIYPLVCMAGHTGARRSELIRMRISDVDFAGGSVVIREKKRVKGKRSTRRAPLTPLLKDALQSWLAVHPGGPWLFCRCGAVAHSKKRSRTTGHQHGAARPTTLKGRLASVKLREEMPGPAPLTVGECHDPFKRTLAGTKWEVVRGLHTLRHSVASSLAAAGVDQRIIDDMLGHVSEEMRRHYRHLTPQVKSQAVLAVFGEDLRSGSNPSR